MVKQQQRATVALKPCYDEIQAALPTASVVHCDETPFKQGAAKAWIWTMVAATFTFFTIKLTRAEVVPIALLGQAFAGAVITDRYAGYNAFNGCRQVYWAHLERDFQSLIDAGGDGAIIGHRLLESLKEMFRLWHLYRTLFMHWSVAGAFVCAVDGETGGGGLDVGVCAEVPPSLSRIIHHGKHGNAQQEGGVRSCDQ